MATEQVTSSPVVGVSKQIPSHPLSPLTAAEITRSADLIKGLYPAKTDLQFKAVTLEEPEKAQLVPYLEAEHHGGRVPKIDRKAFVCYYIRNTVSKQNSCGAFSTWTVHLVPAHKAFF